jgi:AAA ATPase-like protein
MLGTAHEEAAPLLGRHEEQSLLMSLLDEVATRGQPLVLRGEPGIGKSRLLSETAQAARARGMDVLTTTGVQSEAHLPFAGLHQLLRPVRGRAAELPAVQRAALDAAFGLTHEVAPEHYLVATDDRMIPPPAQRAMSERAGSTVVEAPGSRTRSPT